MEDIVKVFYNKDEEIRKLRCNFREGYRKLQATLKDAFKVNGSQELHIFWRDHEGDLIRVSNDSDLQVMLFEKQSRQATDFKLYINTVPPSAVRPTGSSHPSSQHPHTCCDDCNVQPIVGNRFKCLECEDFDLCDSCFHQNSHAHHKMMVLRTPQATHSSPNTAVPTSSSATENQCKAVDGSSSTMSHERGSPMQHVPVSSAPPVWISTTGTPAASTSAPTYGPQPLPVTSASTRPTSCQGLVWSSSHSTPSVWAPPLPGHYPMQPPVLAPTSGCFQPMSPAYPPISAAQSPPTTAGSAPTSTLPPHVDKARLHMLAMGYNDDNGWLTQLLIHHRGDISRCLDDLQSQQRVPSTRP